MHWTLRREEFRAILEGKRCIYPASVFAALSARVAEDLGFESGMFAGSVVSLAVLGAHDLCVLTLTEFAGQAYRTCRAGNLPLMCDASTHPTGWVQQDCDEPDAHQSTCTPDYGQCTDDRCRKSPLPEPSQGISQAR